jgi:hypothetical protein
MAGTQRQREDRSAQEADMPLYMRKDENGYKFVRPIPKELKALLDDKANFIKRLGRDYKKAKIDCAEFTVETNERLAEARGKQGKQDGLTTFLNQDARTRLKTIQVTTALPGQLASLWLHWLNADLDARSEGLTDDEFEALDANVAEMLPAINRALATGQVGKFHPAIDQFLVMRGYRLNASDAEWQLLTYKVLQHMQAGYKTLAARQQGEQLVAPDLSGLPEALRAAWDSQEPPSIKPISRMADVAPLYEAHLSSGATRPGAQTCPSGIGLWTTPPTSRCLR